MDPKALGECWAANPFALKHVRGELERAQANYSPFTSAHEGWAKTWEELDEAWDALRADDIGKARKEMTQVAAMATRFLVDCHDMNTKPEMRPHDSAQGRRGVEWIQICHRHLLMLVDTLKAIVSPTARVWPIASSGWYPTLYLLGWGCHLARTPKDADVFVDDVWETGATVARFMAEVGVLRRVVVLIHKSRDGAGHTGERKTYLPSVVQKQTAMSHVTLTWCEQLPIDKWVLFPWNFDATGHCMEDSLGHVEADWRQGLDGTTERA
jgi:hypothetical protein